MSNVVKFERTHQEKTPSAIAGGKPQKKFSAFVSEHKKAVAVLGSVVLLLVLRAGWSSWTREKTDNAYVEGDVVPVSARIMGYVREIRVEQNKKVEAGDVITLLDDVDLRIEHGVKLARLKKAEADFRRAKTLVGTQALARADFEGIEAQHALAQADLAATELKIDFTQVKAPSSGTIAKVHVRRGQFVQPGQAIVTLVSGAETAWVKANFKETQISRIRPGQAVVLAFDAYPGIQFEGRVHSIFPSSGSVLSLLPAENATGNFTRVIQRIPVRIDVVPQTEHPLRPGMSSSVEVDVHSAR